MKISMVIGRKGDRLKTLFVGGKQSEALAAMAAEVDAEKQRFDEVLLYRAAIPYRRRRLTA